VASPREEMERALAGADGWGGLDNLEAQFKDQARRMREVDLERAQTIAAELDRAPTFVAWLKEMTVDRPGWLGHAPEDLMKIASYGLFRDGQNSIWWGIQRIIAIANDETPRGGD
jgi:hypothetical protein